MKQLTILLCLLSLSIQAQIKGNSDIQTRTFPFENVDTIKIDLYADITIDNSLNEFVGNNRRIESF